MKFWIKYFFSGPWLLIASMCFILSCHAQVQTEHTMSIFTPDDAKIPEGAIGDAIKSGKLISTDTPVYAAPYSGNALSCSHCHVDAGRKAYAAPWIGVVGEFPQYRARSNSIITLKDRINDCFQRSLNGKPLPSDSKEMSALLAYMTWLSQDSARAADSIGRGFALINTGLIPNRDHGQHIYSNQCAVCHGAQGQGLRGQNDEVLFPPLWGNSSFNIGAGMARYRTAAAFIETNMPKGNEGTLTNQEALDVAYFITRQTRPDFKTKRLDWPSGNKPGDVPY